MPHDVVDGAFASRFDAAPPIDAVKSALPRIRNRQAFSRLASTLILIVTDIAGLAVASSLAFLLRIEVLPALVPALTEEVSTLLIDRLWLVLGIGLVCLAYEGLYSKRMSFWQEAEQIVRAITLTFLLILAIVSLGKLSEEVSRTVLVLTYGFSVILLPLGRLSVKTVMARVGIGMQSVLILGAGKTGELAAQSLAGEKVLGYRIVGFLDDDRVKRAQGVRVNDELYPVLGGFRDSDTVMRQMGVRHLVVAAPGMPGHELVGLVNRLQRHAASVTVIPDLFGIPVMGVEADYAFDEQMLLFRIRNNLANPFNMAAKRMFDVVAGSIITIVALPVMFMVAVAIKLDSPGPVVFSQSRIGRNGREFRCYKFRTMHLDNREILQKHLEANREAKLEWQRYAKLRGYDPRVTRVGRLVRKLSLDELPQLINVLKGEMSLVGPRPYLPRERKDLGDYANTILMSRPGITGLWQVSGRSEIDFRGRLRLESLYVRNWSPWLDISLLIRTVRVVMARTGAY